MELGQFLRKNNILIGWTHSYDLQTGHSYNVDFRVPPKFGQSFLQT